MAGVMCAPLVIVDLIITCCEPHSTVTNDNNKNGDNTDVCSLETATLLLSASLHQREVLKLRGLILVKIAGIPMRLLTLVTVREWLFWPNISES